MVRAKNFRGQGLVEYILITALVSLAAIAVFRAFREDVAEAYQRTGDALLAGIGDGADPVPDAP